jgi:hypothetical protein
MATIPAAYRNAPAIAMGFNSETAISAVMLGLKSE